MNENRTENAIKNIKYTSVLLILYYIVSFACRTFFTYFLGTEYLGIQGLFSNVLVLLSFAELGMGDALVYLLYEPLCQNNEEKIRCYLKFSKNVYRIIMLIILCFGLILLPYLKYLIKANNINENITVIYLLYLLNTIISYIFVYKQTILVAVQKKYLITAYTELFSILMNVLQIIVLYFTRNFYLYLITLIICTFLNNYLCSRKASKLYPYIEEKCTSTIPTQTVAIFMRNVWGLLLGKLSFLSFEATDNIYISTFINIKSVGVLSNYTLITITAHSFISQIVRSITSVLGNLGVEATAPKKKEVFDRLYFATCCMNGLFALGFTLLLKEFICNIWLTNEYSLSDYTVILLLIEFYLRGEDIPFATYRDAMGRFFEYKFINALAGILNLILDFVLVGKWGISGILCATIISKTICRYLNVYVVYKFDFELTIKRFFVRHYVWIILLTVEYFLLKFVFSLVNYQSPIEDFLIKGTAILVIYTIGLICVWRQSDEFKYFFHFIKIKLGKIKIKSR